MFKDSTYFLVFKLVCAILRTVRGNTNFIIFKRNPIFFLRDFIKILEIDLKSKQKLNLLALSR